MLARLLTGLVLACLVLNGLLLVALESAALAAQPIDILTHGLYEERLRQLDAGAGARAAALGDSLVYGGHLAEQHGSAWPALALPGQLQQLLTSTRPSEVRVLNLGINGLLFGELSCVLDDVLARQPEIVVINVSPRPFAGDFEADAHASSRPFICRSSHPIARIERALQRSIPALRFRDLWQYRVLGSTPRAYVHHWSSKLFALHTLAPESKRDPGNEDDEDDDAFIAGQLWRLRAAARLNSLDVRPGHPQAIHLERLLAAIRGAAAPTRVVVFYLHEDETALAGQLQLERFHEQRARFSAGLERGLAGLPHARFLELPSADFQGEYVDHVHLTATGYRRLAQRLLAALPDRALPRGTAD